MTDFVRGPFGAVFPLELRPGVRLSASAMEEMAKKSVGKPITDAHGNVIGRIARAWVEGREVRFETEPLD